MVGRQLTLLKEDEVPGGYGAYVCTCVCVCVCACGLADLFVDADAYVCERLWATADDGKRVAISIVFRYAIASL